ncbi:MAG: AraC family transcriptional regulator [Zoogloea oleivorans]|jgi:AraC-like DNA-binding protein|uniref:AraC family transcriptional regulator n=1 Tax=Zoogloea oleivorans TaxID=1552750 RepID=UPI002A35E1F1|nr:AraC family transcriptional regulator [Zoogloea oleivorans]MDY0038316.1 AraC family transcriptional regulator [Zoogloea oleivorans]
MSTDTDRLAHWLVSGLELDTTIFHVGQYCGPWRASTAGRERASFHLVLRGESWLHLEGQAPILLREREGVFLLRDIPHSLTPDARAGTGCQPRPMLPMNPPVAGACGLACGFFQFRGLLGELFRSAFPDYVVIRSDSAALRAVTPLFDLILSEAERDETTPSPLIERLTELLFFYVIRDVARRDEVAAGLLAVARRSEFAPLLDDLLREPGKPWSVEDMAGVACMSRASFCRHFAETSGQPPAQFLLQVRMKIAARRLQGGDSVLRAAEHVGYNSQAAFTRAFKKVIGEQPGAFQRARRVPVLHAPRLDDRAKSSDARA